MLVFMNKELIKPVRFELVTAARTSNMIELVLIQEAGSNTNISIIFNRPSGYFLSKMEMISTQYNYGYTNIRGRLHPETIVQDKILLTELFLMEL